MHLFLASVQYKSCSAGKLRQFQLVFQAVEVSWRLPSDKRFLLSLCCPNTALLFFLSFFFFSSSFLHCCILFIRVSAEVKYKKQPWGLVKSVIEKNTWGGIQENFKQLGEVFSSTEVRRLPFFLCVFSCTSNLIP